MKIQDVEDTLYSQKYEGLRVRFLFGYCPGDYTTSPSEDIQIQGIYFEESEKDLYEIIAPAVIEGIYHEISQYCHAQAA